MYIIVSPKYLVATKPHFWNNDRFSISISWYDGWLYGNLIQSINNKFNLWFVYLFVNKKIKNLNNRSMNVSLVIAY